jgi:POT family proton-dependent oligopeptide transporter
MNNANLAPTDRSPPPGPTLLGHPPGLFTLFFAEMWERFSFYGMRALLTFYMIKGFLKYSDAEAYAVYGAYTALVYTAPLVGGILADQLFGPRRAVILGGLLMAAGHLLMTVQHEVAFFTALALLIAGNGFFKPNISTIVGSLYGNQGGKKDAGFTIFYMGINLGAAMAPILCGYVGETYGWHYGFGLATAGMLIGVAIFAAPNRLTQILILVGGLATAAAMPWLQDSLLQLGVRLFLSASLLLSAGVAVVALGRGGLPKQAGAPPADPPLARMLGGPQIAYLVVYAGVALAIPLAALAVRQSQWAGWALAVATVAALVYILAEAAFRSTPTQRRHIGVILVLMFFSFIFWAFFEQAGSSLNNFTDRNVDRVFQSGCVQADQVGQTLRFRVLARPADQQLVDLPLLSQEQLGYPLQGKPFTMSDLVRLREQAAQQPTNPQAQVLDWPIRQEHIGMGIADSEIPASEFQAVNPVFILLFGLAFSALWGFLSARGWEPSTPVKFALGLVQLGLGFGVLWYGAQQADQRGMVGLGWLVLGYLLHTTGELCLSPVGLSMVTKLSPARIVSTMMGAWFLATAVSQYVAGQIAALTGVPQSEGATEALIPPPTETLALYADVFGRIALWALGAGAICWLLAPLLVRWMQENESKQP